jgi:NDP-sugar pyrophosphorylase family protein
LLVSPEGRFLVHNVDILSDLDVRWFLEQDSPETLATLLLIDAPADRYLLFDDGMRLRGWTNVKTGEVKSPFLPDFDPADFQRYSFCGIHVVSEAVFEKMAAWPDRFSIIDFYLAECAAGTIRGVVAQDLHLIDIGSPEKLAEADRATREGAF